MNVQKNIGNKESSVHLKETFPANKNSNEQEQRSDYQIHLINDEFPFLAHRDELAKETIFFIVIKLSNCQYIYGWFNSKEKASCVYSYTKKFDENLKNRRFRLIDNDNGKVVEPGELISNTLKSINKGSTRTRFSLSVKFVNNDPK